MHTTTTQNRFKTPPPLPAVAFEQIVDGRVAPADRRRVRTETSASSGWAARLAQLFPDKSAVGKSA
jgi:hypothetical protein